VTAPSYDKEALELGETLIHSRSYDVKSYRIDAETIRLVGRVIDAKPPGLFVQGDPEALHVHDMTVSLTITFPDLQINAIDVTFVEHPHIECPGIVAAYEGLVGQSIAAGFSRFVNTTFGRQHGCTHIGALLKAMAPVAVQSMYSMRQLPHTNAGPAGLSKEWSGEERAMSMAFTLNSCHVWDEEGAYAKGAMSGESLGAPVWIEKRLTKLGREDEINGWE